VHTELSSQASDGSTHPVASHKLLDLNWAELLVGLRQRRPLGAIYALTCGFVKMILVPINGE
jgi:hypothetical protein